MTTPRGWPARRPNGIDAEGRSGYERYARAIRLRRFRPLVHELTDLVALVAHLVDQDVPQDRWGYSPILSDGKKRLERRVRKLRRDVAALADEYQVEAMAADLDARAKARAREPLERGWVA